MENNNLAPAFIIGGVVSVVGVGLFLLMYFVVLATSDPAVRLFGSFFVPIILMGLGVAIYYIRNR